MRLNGETETCRTHLALHPAFRVTPGSSSLLGFVPVSLGPPRALDGSGWRGGHKPLLTTENGESSQDPLIGNQRVNASKSLIMLDYYKRRAALGHAADTYHSSEGQNGHRNHARKGFWRHASLFRGRMRPARPSPSLVQARQATAA